MKHLIVSKRIGQDDSFSPVVPKIDETPVERLVGAAKRSHAARLAGQFAKSAADGRELRGRFADLAAQDAPGVLVRFDAKTSAGINLEFFKQRHGMELLGSRGRGRRQQVRVFAPDATMEKLAAAVLKYGETDDATALRRARYSDFFDRIETAQSASVDTLWNAEAIPIPDGIKRDWEVWVRPKALEAVQRNAPRFSLRLVSEPILFPMAAVVIVSGTYQRLKQLLEATSAAIEIRPASSMAVPPQKLAPRERVQLGRRLASRIVPAEAGAPRTTIVDTGVRFAHPLLRASLPDQRTISVATGIAREDAFGHGTQMAGAALFGDLNDFLADDDPIVLTTALESVAIFDGTMSPFRSVANAVSAAHRAVETENAPRVYSLSFRAPEDPSNGLPSALSGLIDGLSFARTGERRLFCTAAGNLDDIPVEVSGYISANDGAGIETPGQAVNALTVGAYTDLDGAGRVKGHAARGDLCPTARTSINWTHHLAYKPDIVMEGGNRVADAAGVNMDAVEELSVLTTHCELPNRPFAAGGETSIATAAAAGLCTRLMAEYPALRPETIRGLIVHSARWTPAMLARRSVPTARGALEILRRFGWGVPDERRALASTANALTMVIEDELNHLTGKPIGDGVKYDQMRFYDLPWPSEALEALGSEQVTLRITLSYFAEPHPLAINYERNRDYFSHGLKFDLKHPDDDREQAIARINKNYRDPFYNAPTRRPVGRWFLGERLRSNGTLRQDVWTGPARDLSAMGALCVFPQYGWWRDFDTDVEPHRTVRFSLMASIETPRLDVDLVTEAEAALARLPVRAETSVRTEI